LPQRLADLLASPRATQLFMSPHVICTRDAEPPLDHRGVEKDEHERVGKDGVQDHAAEELRKNNCGTPAASVEARALMPTPRHRGSGFMKNAECREFIGARPAGCQVPPKAFTLDCRQGIGGSFKTQQCFLGRMGALGVGGLQEEMHFPPFSDLARAVGATGVVVAEFLPLQCPRIVDERREVEL